MTVRSVPAGDQRLLPDRRHRPTRWLSCCWLTGRRRGGRRVGERWNVYVDRCTLAEYGLVLAVLALAVLDTVFTVRHVGTGIDEANPIMAWMLGTGGTGLFAAVKLGMTSLALVFLLGHIRFRPTRTLLVIVLGLYATVLGVHVRVFQLTASA